MALDDFDEPLNVFFDALENRATRDHYQRHLKYFFKFLKLDGDSLESHCRVFTKQALENPSWATTSIMKFIRFHKERVEKGEISAVSIANYYKPIKLFCDMNDISLNWKKITRAIPKSKRHSTDRIPTLDEIKQLLNYPDRRLKAAVLVMMSSGIRVGAWDYLRWGDITPILKDDKVLAAKMIVYRGESEEYTTFITPEAYQALKEYLEFRISHKEIVNENSWVLRDEFDVSKSSKGLATVPKQLKSTGLKSLIERALFAEGIRKPLPKGQKRHEFKTDHGFRKFFKTIAERSMKSLHVEMLMGHSTGLANNYYRIPEKELLEEYTKAIQDLSIYESTPQEDKIQYLEREIREMKMNLADLMIDYGKERSGELISKHPKLLKGIKFSTESDAVIIKDFLDDSDILY
ncbi:MAG: tyrosine-type recombinase/integrase [Thaumarchaeota archaeon]|nr:tyrosine-type recombinase/integrase [Nitrososphaerota archaeon]